MRARMCCSIALLSTMLCFVGACQSNRSPKPFMFYPNAWGTPVHQAAEHASAAELGTQLQQLPEPDARDKYGRTPLMLASRSSGKVTPNLQVLIDAGAHVNAADNNGMTSLMYASVGTWRHAHGISREPEDVVARMKLLIDAGADVNARTTDGRSVLMIAASPGTYEVMTGAAPCRLLVKYGADIHARDQAGRTALMHAASSAGNYISALLELGEEINVQDNDGLTPLMHAAKQYWFATDATKELLRGNPNLELCDRRGWTALTYAALCRGTPSCVAALLDAGADFRPLEWNRLHIAAMMRNASAVESELAGGADPNARDKFGRTPLMWASCYSNKDTVANHRLLSAGAEVGAQDNDGATALHHAAARAWTDELLVLIKAHAQVDARDFKGRTPLMWAAVERFGESRAESLLKSGAAINAVDQEGKTALILAVIAADKNLDAGRIVELLMKHRADATIRDSSGQTALDYANRAEPYVRGNMLRSLSVH